MKDIGPLYRCPHCKKLVRRKSKKKWIKSYCDEELKYVRLQMLPDKEQF